MSIYSKPAGNIDFEKVVIDEWINGVVLEVQERRGVEKPFKDKETGETKIRKVDQVRLKFDLDGYEHPHYSRWMTNSMNERANLFLMLQQIFSDGVTSSDFVNLSKLTGMKVKTMWNEVKLNNGDMFQFMEKIRALDSLPDIVVSEEDIDTDTERINKELDEAAEGPQDDSFPG